MERWLLQTVPKSESFRKPRLGTEILMRAATSRAAPRRPQRRPSLIRAQCKNARNQWWRANRPHGIAAGLDLSEQGYESHVQMFFSDASGWSCRKVSRASTQIPIVCLDRGSRVGETRMMPAWSSPDTRNC